VKHDQAREHGGERRLDFVGHRIVPEHRP